MEWKYKIDLEDERCFDKYEKECGFSFPMELKKFIIENNAASPNKKCVVFAGKERVLDYLISFNENEDESITFREAYKSIGKKDIIPFASDPFGNYFYYFLDGNKIGFYDHEELLFIESQYSLSEFLNALYD